jgi:hypothetical protein
LWKTTEGIVSEVSEEAAAKGIAPGMTSPSDGARP